MAPLSTITVLALMGQGAVALPQHRRNIADPPALGAINGVLPDPDLFDSDPVLPSEFEKLGKGLPAEAVEIDDANVVNNHDINQALEISRQVASLVGETHYSEYVDFLAEVEAKKNGPSKMDRLQVFIKFEELNSRIPKDVSTQYMAAFANLNPAENAIVLEELLRRNRDLGYQHSLGARDVESVPESELETKNALPIALALASVMLNPPTGKDEGDSLLVEDDDKPIADSLDKPWSAVYAQVAEEEDAQPELETVFMNADDKLAAELFVKHYNTALAEINDTSAIHNDTERAEEIDAQTELETHNDQKVNLVSALLPKLVNAIHLMLTINSFTGQNDKIAVTDDPETTPGTSTVPISKRYFDPTAVAVEETIAFTTGYTSSQPTGFTTETTLTASELPDVATVLPVPTGFVLTDFWPTGFPHPTEATNTSIDLVEEVTQSGSSAEEEQKTEVPEAEKTEAPKSNDFFKEMQEIREQFGAVEKKEQNKFPSLKEEKKTGASNATEPVKKKQEDRHKYGAVEKRSEHAQQWADYYNKAGAYEGLDYDPHAYLKEYEMTLPEEQRFYNQPVQKPQPAPAPQPASKPQDDQPIIIPAPQRPCPNKAPKPQQLNQDPQAPAGQEGQPGEEKFEDFVMFVPKDQANGDQPYMLPAGEYNPSTPPKRLPPGVKPPPPPKLDPESAQKLNAPVNTPLPVQKNQPANPQYQPAGPPGGPLSEGEHALPGWFPTRPANLVQRDEIDERTCVHPYCREFEEPPIPYGGLIDESLGLSSLRKGLKNKIAKPFKKAKPTKPKAPKFDFDVEDIFEADDDDYDDDNDNFAGIGDSSPIQLPPHLAHASFPGDGEFRLEPPYGPFPAEYISCGRLQCPYDGHELSEAENNECYQPGGSCPSYEHPGQPYPYPEPAPCESPFGPCPEYEYPQPEYHPVMHHEEPPNPEEHPHPEFYLHPEEHFQPEYHPVMHQEEHPYPEELPHHENYPHPGGYSQPESYPELEYFPKSEYSPEPEFQPQPEHQPQPEYQPEPEYQSQPEEYPHPEEQLRPVVHSKEYPQVELYPEPYPECHDCGSHDGSYAGSPEDQDPYSKYTHPASECHDCELPPQPLEHPHQALDHPPQALDHPPQALEHPLQALQHPPQALEHPSQPQSEPFPAQSYGSAPQAALQHPPQPQEPAPQQTVPQPEPPYDEPIYEQAPPAVTSHDGSYPVEKSASPQPPPESAAPPPETHSHDDGSYSDEPPEQLEQYPVYEPPQPAPRPSYPWHFPASEDASDQPPFERPEVPAPEPQPAQLEPECTECQQGQRPSPQGPSPQPKELAPESQPEFAPQPAPEYISHPAPEYAPPPYEHQPTPDQQGCPCQQGQGPQVYPRADGDGDGNSGCAC